MKSDGGRRYAVKDIGRVGPVLSNCCAAPLELTPEVNALLDAAQPIGVDLPTYWRCSECLS